MGVVTLQCRKTDGFVSSVTETNTSLVNPDPVNMEFRETVANDYSAQNACGYYHVAATGNYYKDAAHTQLVGNVAVK